MYSQRCSSCGQLITLKTEEVRFAVEQAEASSYTHYDMSCPKCRRSVKMPVKSLKLKLPRNIIPVEAEAEAEAAPTPAATPAPAAPVQKKPKASKAKSK
jgi:predicted RNA-binding Zn-ribbon protein involved in translation (DUF1610 family)